MATVAAEGDLDKKIKNDVLVLAHLFLSKHINKPIQSQTALLDALTAKNFKDQCRAVLTTLIKCEENKRSSTIKNIVGCCLLNHVLLEKRADDETKEAVEYCLELITHKTYLPSTEKLSYLITDENETAQAIYALVKEKEKELTSEYGSSLINADNMENPNLEEVFRRSLLLPETYTSKFFNEARLLSGTSHPLVFTLWNFLCDRNIYHPPKKDRERMLAALKVVGTEAKEDENIVLQTMALLVLQLLFHNGNFT